MAAEVGEVGAGVTRLLAIRHGETDWNASGRIQGHTDIELNATGRHQAECMAAALAGESLQTIYASDLARAWQTAQPLAARSGAPLIAAPGLRERGFGVFEGLGFEAIERQWPDEARRWRQREPDFAPGGGEALRGFHARVIEAAERLARAHRGQTIALVAHGGVLDCLYRAATGLALDAPRHWTLGNATINRLLHADQGFGLLSWNDSAHLDQPPADEPAS